MIYEENKVKGQGKYLLMMKPGGPVLGELYREVNGCWVFWEDSRKGVWTEGDLEGIVEKLHELNGIADEKLADATMDKMLKNPVME